MQILSIKNDGDVVGNEFVRSMPVFIVTGIMAIMNFVLALGKELVFFQVIKTKNAYSAKNNFHSRIILFYKVITPILMVFIGDGDGKSILIAIISIALSFATLTNLYLRLPFYQTTLLKWSYALLS